MQLKERLGRLKEKLERKLKENWRLKERPKRRFERNHKSWRLCMLRSLHDKPDIRHL